MILRPLLTSVIFLASTAALSHATEAPATASTQEKITFNAAGANDGEVSGILTKPADAQSEKLPAVVLLHHGGGWQNTQTPRYAAALAQAGYVTLEVILFHTREQQKAKPSAYLPHVYGALHYLGTLPNVDSNRIAISGGSYGGTLALLSVTEWAEKTYGAGGHFAAAAPFYPVCYFVSWFNKKKPPTPGIPSTVYEQYGRSQIKIYAGANDDYDNRDPKACEAMIQELPSDQQPKFSVKVFNSATHGWDHPRSSSFYEGIACKGKGCINTNNADSKVTAEGIADLIAFLNSAMPK